MTHPSNLANAGRKICLAWLSAILSLLMISASANRMQAQTANLDGLSLEIKDYLLGAKPEGESFKFEIPQRKKRYTYYIIDLDSQKSLHKDFYIRIDANIAFSIFKEKDLLAKNTKNYTIQVSDDIKINRFLIIKFSKSVLLDDFSVFLTKDISSADRANTDRKTQLASSQSGLVVLILFGIGLSYWVLLVLRKSQPQGRFFTLFYDFEAEESSAKHYLSTINYLIITPIVFVFFIFFFFEKDKSIVDFLSFSERLLWFLIVYIVKYITILYMSRLIFDQEFFKIHYHIFSIISIISLFLIVYFIYIPFNLIDKYIYDFFGAINHEVGIKITMIFVVVLTVLALLISTAKLKFANIFYFCCTEFLPALAFYKVLTA